MTDQATKMRELRARRKAEGVCIYCGDPLTTETMCERHAEAKRTGSGPLAERGKRRYPITRRATR